MNIHWLCHYGLQVKVKYDALEISYPDKTDGPQRFIYYRGRHDLDRIMVYGKAGVISLDAIHWLSDQEIELYVIGTDNQIIAQLGATRKPTVELRVAQVDCMQTGHGVGFVKWLLAKKIAGHKRIIDIPELDKALVNLQDCLTVEDCMHVEAVAALAYWSSLAGTPLSWKKSELKKLPDHWLRMQGRNTGLRNNRYATDPVNAVLNYCYAILEAETKIAAYSEGFDLDFGILHSGKEYRQNFVWDMMEPLRYVVDKWVFSWLAKKQLRYNDFVSLNSGECRLHLTVAKSVAVGLVEVLRPQCRVLAKEAREVLEQII